MAVGALEAKFWDLFCVTMARPDLQPFGFVSDRAAWVRAELAADFARQPLAYWTEKFAASDCGVTPVLEFTEALAHPQLQARGMVVEADGLTQFAPPLRSIGLSTLRFVARLPPSARTARPSCAKRATWKPTLSACGGRG